MSLSSANTSKNSTAGTRSTEPVAGTVHQAPTRREFNFRPVCFFGLVLAALVSGHCLAVDSRIAIFSLNPWLQHHEWILMLVALAVLTWSARRLYRNRLQHHIRLADIILLLLSTHWLSLGAHDYLHESGIPIGYAIALGFIIFVPASVGAHHLRRIMETVKNLLYEPTKKRILKTPIKGLVLFVSPPTTVPDVTPTPAVAQDACWAVRIRTKNRAGESGDVELQTGDPSAACREMDKLPATHNWQQMLRSISPVRHQLEHVWLIGSPGKPPPDALTVFRETKFSDGSGVYLTRCAEFIRHFVTETTIIHYSANQDAHVNFENFEALIHYLRNHKPTGMKHLPPAQVAVDITGGIKVSSVAGAVLTLNMESVIQYVPTGANTNPAGGPDLEAYTYDLRWDNPPNLGH